MTTKQFYTSILVFFILEYIFLLFLLPKLYILKSGNTLMLVPIFVLLVIILQHLLLKRKIKKSKKNFIVPFIAIFGSKFILLLFASLIYILYLSENNTEFVIIFITNYFVSITLSISGLVKDLKN